MILTLPWPYTGCSPNFRSRTWHKAARAKRAYRADCASHARFQGARKLAAERVSVTITFKPPDRRSRDDDNAIGSFKSGRDGIADVIGIDDARWTVTYRHAEPVKGGAVLVQIEAIQ